MSKFTDELKKDGWEEIGNCDVDAGIIYLGDPCYILPRKEDKDKGLDYDKLLTYLHHGKYVRWFDQERYDALLEKFKATGKEPDHVDIAMMKDTATHNICEGDLKQVFKIPHERGHDGRGVVVNSGYGDGSYTVYAKFVPDDWPGNKKMQKELNMIRVKEVRIVFIDDSEEGEDEAVR